MPDAIFSSVRVHTSPPQSGPAPRGLPLYPSAITVYVVGSKMTAPTAARVHGDMLSSCFAWLSLNTMCLFKEGAVSIILVSILAPIGALFCLLATLVALRGYGGFLLYMLITLYRIALGEVAAIELVSEDDDDDGDGD